MKIFSIISKIISIQKNFNKLMESQKNDCISSHSESCKINNMDLDTQSMEINKKESMEDEI